MAENSRLCGVCDQQHVTTPSTCWCSECDQSFCSECKKSHSFITALKSHKLIPIDEYLDLKESFNLPDGRCRRHDEKYQMFCKKHDEAICPQCMEEHTKCIDITSITKVTKEIQKSAHVHDVMQRCSDNKANVSKIEAHLEGRLREVQDRKSDLLDEVAKYRQEIIEQLDESEKNLKDEITSRSDAINVDMTNTLKEVRIQKDEIEKREGQLKSLIALGSEVQIFFGIRSASSLLDQQQQNMTQLKSQGKLDKSFITLKKKSIKVEKLGSISVDNIPLDLKFKKDKAIQSAVPGSISKPISSIVAKLVKSVETNGENIRGCDISPDGKLIFSDYNTKKIIVNRDGLLSEITALCSQPSYYPYNAVAVDNNTLAVSCHRYVYLIDINKGNISRSLETDGLCYYVTYSNKQLFCGMENKVQILNVSDLSTVTQFKTNGKDIYHIARLESSKLFYTSRDDNSVICCDMTGKIIWTFSDYSIIVAPKGVTHDQYGNVYITCYSLSNVIVISSDGKHGRVLLTKEHGLDKPTGICFDPKNNHLLVCNEKSKAFLFQIC